MTDPTFDERYQVQNVAVPIRTSPGFRPSESSSRSSSKSESDASAAAIMPTIRGHDDEKVARSRVSSLGQDMTDLYTQLRPECDAEAAALLDGLFGGGATAVPFRLVEGSG